MVQDHSPDGRRRHLRLLIPIDATEKSRWAVGYALQRHELGDQVEACFLNVGEPITQWEVLRFRTQVEIAAFQSERATAFIEEACAPLRSKGIDCRGFFREGNLVFSILDTAEELECDEIVLPQPKRGLLSLFDRDVVRMVMHKRRSVPVTIVDKGGAAVCIDLH